jgi:phthiocerol/phenolphthiocerol synthesis type-I polyketide synthase C
MNIMRVPFSDHPANSLSLVDLIQQWAIQQPNRLAYTFLADGEKEELLLTYESLDRQARAIASRLQSIGAGGKRLLLFYPPGLEYVAAVFGCLYAGAVAVLAFPPRLNRPTPRLQAIVDDAQATDLLTTGSVLSEMERHLDLMPQLKGLRWHNVAEIPPDEADGWRAPPITSETLALLQYTSGSTRTPQGVMVSHGNLMHNLALIKYGFGLDAATDRGVTWLPIYHDMGLIGTILQTAYMGASTVLMSPASFLQRPVRWLEALTRYRGTSSGGPNFAYQLCVDKITAEQRKTLDLSSWRLAFCGAEPIRAQTLERFAETFESCGFRRDAFYPCYGMAEATLLVSGGLGAGKPVVHSVSRKALKRNKVIEVTSEDDTQTLVGCGRALRDQNILIVDPDTLRPCARGMVGEIWVSSPSVAMGYWNRAEETAQTFQAYLAESNEGPFLRTGDLGYLHDGELFIAGRMKDLIVIHGHNHYPQDIELTMEQSHEALRKGGGAAFSVVDESSGSECLVIVQEVERHNRNLNVEAVVAAIRGAIAEHHLLQTHAVVLVKPLRLPRTSSGKVMRQATRAKFLDRGLEAVGTWTQESRSQNVTDEPSPVRDNKTGPAPTGEEIQAWLIARTSALMSVDALLLYPGEPFARYGIDSVQAVGLAGDLEHWLGRRLSPTLLFEYPTIEKLARHLGQTETSSYRKVNVEVAPENRREPIAIVGIGCRFPGANGPEAFWQLLRDGVDAIVEVPPDRWDGLALYDPDPNAPGKLSTRWGGFLEGVDQFDLNFFKISRREAVRMDPQQRMLLEVAWEAFEDAGMSLEHLAGSATGVFIGISNNDYRRVQGGDHHQVEAYDGTGNAFSIAANRLSYTFDLRGPSMAVDTACSSSLVAVHLACGSLFTGESSVAIAGGVNLILSPEVTMNFTRAKLMAPDGRCKTFDARADGYVRSEGAGLVVLKPLSKALTDGDRIYAVIRGSAINQDGRTNGLMAPNPQAQEDVVTAAYRNAGLAPGQAQYTEAHGTGTLLGDLIEAKALGRVLADGRATDSHCALGSVKTNIGHLEAAAGVAGLIKVALMLKHQEIPPNLHFQEANPHIPFDELPLRVQQTLSSWPKGISERIAGVSSFGFGGTNAEVILSEAAPGLEAQQTGVTPASSGAHLLPHLLPLSAHVPAALNDYARLYGDLLSADPPGNASEPRDICYTASLRRTHLDHRLAVVFQTREELAERLNGFARGEAQLGVYSGSSLAGRPPKLAFIFSGQGTQWLGMGRELLEQEPAFKATMVACDGLLKPYAGWSLLEELCADEARSRLSDTEIVQPVLCAFQIALAALWRHWGVVPDAVVGHSLGEVAAAHTAGALSLEDAMRITFHRGSLMQRTTGKGRMAALELSLDEASHALSKYADRLTIAAINSRTSTVISGDSGALNEVLDSLRHEGVGCHYLPVNYSFHSVEMDAIQSEFARALEPLGTRPPTLPIVSTLTGGASNGHMFDSDYWRRQIRQPVLFADAVGVLIDLGHQIFLEIGPDPVLLGYIKQGLKQRKREGITLASVRRGESDRVTLLKALGGLYAQGRSIEWRQLYPAGGKHVQLPRYPWQRERCWLEKETADTDPGNNGTAKAKSDREFVVQDGNGFALHPLLGHRVELAHLPESYVWENKLDKWTLSYLEDHAFQGTTILPGSSYIEMAFAAWTEAFGNGPCVLADVEFRSAMFLPGGSTRTLQIVLSPKEKQASFRIFSRAGKDARETGWTLHALGRISGWSNRSAEREPQSVKEIQRIKDRCREQVSVENFYDEMRERGLEYGPAFREIQQLWKGDGEALGEIQVPQSLKGELDSYRFHPAILDACAQVLVAAGSGAGSFLPLGAAEVRFYGPAEDLMWSHARARVNAETVPGRLVGDVRLLGKRGEVLVEALGLCVRYLDGDAQSDIQFNMKDWLYNLQWEATALPQDSSSPASGEEDMRTGTWLILADKGGVGVSLAEHLTKRGNNSILVRPGTVYQRLDQDHFQIRPEEPEDLRRLIAALASDDSPPCRGIVHLWTLDAPSSEEVTLRSLEAEQTRGCGTVLRLIQDLVRWEGGESGRLWLVTRSAQAVLDNSEPTAFIQAPLWGLGRSIALEHPSIWGGLIDLDPKSRSGNEGAQLCSVLRCANKENQLAFRNGTTYVARLVRQRHLLDSDSTPHWQADGSYLITGGLGALGLQVARWLVEQGVRRVILMARTPLPSRNGWGAFEEESRLGKQIAAIKQLESLGASVHMAAVDVSDEAQLATFLETYQREGWPPIRGVFHAAGVLQDQTLLQLNDQAVANVFRAKVIGGWLVHRLLEDAPLEFFVTFSSSAALLGSAGQANYAAANAFLDSLAHYRQALGKPALSLNWGPWAEIGMAANSGQRRRLALRGVKSIQPNDGLDVFGHLLVQRVAQVGVIALNWTQLFKHYPEFSQSPLLSRMFEEAQASSQGGVARAAEGLVRQTILAAEPITRQSLLEAYTLQEVARIIGVKASQLSVQQPLDTLGIDSLMGIELKNRVETDLRVVVPVVRLLEGPTIREFAALLLEQINGAAATLLAPGLLPQESPNNQTSSLPEQLITVIQPHGTRQPFFCLHPGALDVQCYSALTQQLGDDQPFYALQPAALDGYRSLNSEFAIGTPLDQIAAACLAALCSVDPHGPYFLGGWSIGGVVAFEMAHQLHRQGKRIDLLALFDSPAPLSDGSPGNFDDTTLVPVFASYLAARCGKKLVMESDNLRGANLEELFKRLLELAHSSNILRRDIGLPQIQSLFQIYKSGLRRATRQLCDYKAQIYPGRITLFRPTRRSAAFELAFPNSALAWAQLTSQPLELHDTAGEHYTMFLEPDVRILAERLLHSLKPSGVSLQPGVMKE